MNRLLWVCVFSLLAAVGFAQQDPQFSFNMFNQLSYNPGFAGSNDAICVSSIHRQQWIGFEGRPMTTVFNGHAAINPMGIKSGVGLVILQEQLGFQKNFVLNASYAYRAIIGEGVLGIGLGLGLQNTAFNGDWIVPGPNTNPYDDPMIPRMESRGAFDLSFGAFYKNNDNGFYAGISTTHLTEPQVKLASSTAPFIKRHYYIVTSYPIRLGNPAHELKPNIFIKSDLATTQFTGNLTYEYNRKFWGGVSYNINDALTFMVGMNLNMGVSFGYAYDLGLSDIGSYNSGSHELYVRYCFSLSMNKTPGRYKSVRFL